MIALAAGAYAVIGSRSDGAGASPTASLPVAQASIPAPSTASLAPSAGPSSVAVASPSAAPTATPAPTPTPTPAGKQARITAITVKSGVYVVTYEVFGYKQKLPGMHVHFFFDTVPPKQAGMPGAGPWYVYGGPIPFRGYKVSDRPAKATQMCILVANPDHSVIQDTGNCVDLPK